MAEKLVLEDISTGASNDIERATKVARNMIMRYGFSEKLGPIVYGHDENEIFLGRDFSSTPSYSENVAAEIDAEIREIIDTAFERAVEILTEHMDQLHQVAQYLFEHEKMEEDQFAAMIEGRPVPETSGSSFYRAAPGRQPEPPKDTAPKEEPAPGGQAPPAEHPDNSPFGEEWNHF